MDFIIIVHSKNPGPGPVEQQRKVQQLEKERVILLHVTITMIKFSLSTMFEFLIKIYRKPCRRNRFAAGKERPKVIYLYLSIVRPPPTTVKDS